MEIGIVGLGLIGGSLAKAISQNTDNTVYGFDISKPVVHKAMLVDAIEQPLTDKLLSQCDIVIVALYPQDTVDYVTSHADLFKKGSIVCDCSGVKRMVCEQLIPLAEEKGFLFVGGHPMAGREHSGFTYAKKSLFNNASMIFTPTKGPIESMEKLKKLFTSIGFTNIEIATPEEHDRKIAFTSQLAHVVSSSYVKDFCMDDALSFSGGSFQDMTRVATMDESMWAALFLDNRDNLLYHLDLLIENLTDYRDALKQRDEERLQYLIAEGRQIQEENVRKRQEQNELQKGETA